MTLKAHYVKFNIEIRNGKEVKNEMNKKKKLPRCIAVVDFEHWYISLERQYSMKPDIKAWKDGLEKDYNIEEIAFFGDFSNQGLRGELDKIRNATSMIIDTQNNSEYYKKDFTDFIMLDYIYQKAMTSKKTDTFIIFTGDGHFSSVVRFIINVCHKKVGIYGITNAVSSQLKSGASWYREIPSDTDAYKTYYKMIADYMSYLMVHREFGEKSTKEKIIERISVKGGIGKKAVSHALEQMVSDGYLYKTASVDSKNKKITILKANWELLERDKIWRQP